MNSMSITCKQVVQQPSTLHLPTSGLDMQFLRRRSLQKDKVVVVMGATGTGKSRLSIDLATRFPAEVVNSDKMQVYEGLDIVTNKITPEERRGIPHHLLGIVDPNADFTASDFCDLASLTTKSIVGRGRVPIIVGGSNSFIEALIDDDDYQFRSKYELCFLWVDVSIPVLHSFVSNRVEQMIVAGMVDEARKMFKPNADYSRGIRRAIGVPEFDQYFRAELSSDKDNLARAMLLKEAINMIKINNCKLACRQLEKIFRLRNLKKWKVHRLDATDVFRKSDKEADKAWENLVARPSTMIVREFLNNISPMIYTDATSIRFPAETRAAMAAASY